MRFLYSAVVVSLVGLLFGCGDDASQPDDPSEFCSPPAQYQECSVAFDSLEFTVQPKTTLRSLASKEDIAEFCKVECRKITGEIDITRVSLTDLSFLAPYDLSEAWVSVNSSTLLSLEGLEGKEELLGLGLAGVDGVTDLRPLRDLRRVTLGLGIEGTDVRSLDGLQGLESAGSLGFAESPLTQITELESLRSVDQLRLTGLPSVKEVDLGNIESLNNLQMSSMFGIETYTLPTVDSLEQVTFNSTSMPQCELEAWIDSLTEPPPLMTVYSNKPCE